jgi:hypothetical protein
MRLKNLFYFFWLSIAVTSPGVASNSVAKNLRLGDRIYISSVLTEIFGPQSKESVKKFVLSQPGVFGGPCDFYQQVRIAPRNKPESLADPESFCPLGKFSFNLSMIGYSNMPRQAYVIRACENLTSQEQLVNFTLMQLFGTEQIKPPNRKNLVMAFQLFNPEREPSAAVLKALEKIWTRQKDLQKSWSEILLALCIDPSWQII